MYSKKVQIQEKDKTKLDPSKTKKPYISIMQTNNERKSAKRKNGLIDYILSKTKMCNRKIIEMTINWFQVLDQDHLVEV